jgi:hypothetical protein
VSLFGVAINLPPPVVKIPHTLYLPGSRRSFGHRLVTLLELQRLFQARHI